MKIEVYTITKTGLDKMTYQTPELKVHGSVDAITKFGAKPPGTADGQGSEIFG
jgi:hypothetical protein